MAEFLVILRNALPYLAGRYPDDWVGRCIVIGIFSEDFDAECALLEQIRLTVDGCADNKSEECREPAAVAEMRIGKQSLKLGFYCEPFLFCEGLMSFRSFRKGCHRRRWGDYTPLLEVKDAPTRDSVNCCVYHYLRTFLPVKTLKTCRKSLTRVPLEAYNGCGS